MEVIQFSILIDAPVGAVWNTMLDPVTYREWTKPFTPTSFYEGTWDEGAEIRFLMTKDDGTTAGMFSRIARRIDHQFISIEHLGTIDGDKIDTNSEETAKWAPAFENYSFESLGYQTKLSVEMQTDPEYKPMFESMWPQALQLLKSMCEE